MEIYQTLTLFCLNILQTYCHQKLTNQLCSNNNQCMITSLYHSRHLPTIRVYFKNAFKLISRPFSPPSKKALQIDNHLPFPIIRTLSQLMMIRTQSDSQRSSWTGLQTCFMTICISVWLRWSSFNKCNTAVDNKRRKYSFLSKMTTTSL